ncbi:MAG: CBS domain-containing protein [Chloroflexi bacterium]|nr:CBS domain-containing protein [Chloroflexota bacterium]
MRLREFMTTNVVTVSSKTTVADAKKYMVTHKIRRLPVVDKGKLVGMVSDRRVAEASPSAATTLSVWEINHLLDKMTVSEIMTKRVISVPQGTTAESALALAQEHGVGSLPVLDEEERLVGIVTTNDFVYRIMNPLLGIGKPGVRLHIYSCDTTQKIEEVVRFINKAGLQIEALHVDDSIERETRDLIVQVNTEDANGLISDLTNRGYSVIVRDR